LFRVIIAFALVTLKNVATANQNVAIVVEMTTLSMPARRPILRTQFVFFVIFLISLPIIVSVNGYSKERLKKSYREASDFKKNNYHTSTFKYSKIVNRQSIPVETTSVPTSLANADFPNLNTSHHFFNSGKKKIKYLPPLTKNIFLFLMNLYHLCLTVATLTLMLKIHNHSHKALMIFLGFTFCLSNYLNF
jgi:hypothetical protein